ncbi:response regulator [Desulfofundulus thermobenzoicus]|uniref:Stage 0 sporulation protein A homolog n=1 Tax=Desulfofundulus thermobenzoicus TaxID=29376 RepID=A0A6N7INP4_9FIRM|nr:response regulator [Desulfofundulus thermobenzoicus]
MKILIVEDNGVNRVLLRDILALLDGVEIFEAADAENGIALARTKKPDLVLMDLQLPGLDGIAATRILKDAPETRKIPVVAVSSYAFPREKNAFFEAGGDAYYTKPLNVDEILEVVERYRGGGGARGTKGENPGR